MKKIQEHKRIKKELELKSEKVEENVILKKNLEISWEVIEEIKLKESESSIF